MAADPDRVIAAAALPEGAAGLCVAFSGGSDSGALLALLHRHHPRRLRAVHVHHGLQEAADGWAAFCERRCGELGIGFQLLRVRVAEDHPDGPEAAARAARYAALEAELRDDEVLAVAHHRDDQAETFLSRALRGGGARGLGGMRPLRRFGRGWLWRPLLEVSRAELHDWLQAQPTPASDWIMDPHNLDPRYERVWLRTRLMPLLRQRWPAAGERLAQSARLIAEADVLLDELAAIDAATVIDADGTAVIESLRALSDARRRNLLRHWIAAGALPAPPATALARLPELFDAAEDAEPLIDWPGAELRRYRGRVYLMATMPPAPRTFVSSWDGSAPLTLPPGCGELRASSPGFAATVRFAAGGERYRAPPATQHRSLKNLFQEAGVPPWRRRRTPLVFVGEELKWIGGLALASDLPIEWRR